MNSIFEMKFPWMLFELRVVVRVDRGERGQLEPIEPVRLLLRVELVVADELVVLRQLIRGFSLVDLQPRLEGFHREVRLAKLILGFADRAKPPQLVLLDVAAQLREAVTEQRQAVGVFRPEPAAALHAPGNLIGVDIERLPVAVGVVDAGRAVIRVAARLDDEHHHHPGRPHLGVGAHGVHGHFVKRVHVRVVAVGVGEFRPVDPFVIRPLAGGAIRREGGLRARRAATHVDAAHLDRRRLRQHRPRVIAAIGQRRQFLGVEAGRDCRRLRIDHRRGAAHGDRFLEAGHVHRNVQSGRETGANLNVGSLHGREARQLERDRVETRCNRNEPERTRVARHRVAACPSWLRRRG